MTKNTRVYQKSSWNPSLNMRHFSFCMTSMECLAGEGRFPYPKKYTYSWTSFHDQTLFHFQLDSWMVHSYYVSQLQSKLIMLLLCSCLASCIKVLRRPRYSWFSAIIRVHCSPSSLVSVMEDNGCGIFPQVVWGHHTGVWGVAGTSKLEVTRDREELCVQAILSKCQISRCLLPCICIREASASLILFSAISILGSKSMIFCLHPNNLLRWPNSSLRTRSWLCTVCMMIFTISVLSL